jgi:hypothetical protein
MDELLKNTQIHADGEPVLNTTENSQQADISISTTTETSGDLWDQIGFHKPIAGFYYNITLGLISIGLSALLFGYLIGFFYPYPESLGYKDIAFGYFSLMFTIFDIGTGAVMGRFIPEVNIKKPEKMIHLLQYFIWYQMFTGLVQTTIVSVYALFFATQGSMAYIVWIMLICSTTQWPGFLWCFKNVIDALQFYDKSKILDFLLGNVFQNITNYLFLYLGRLYGEANPVIGPILGIAIGAAIGSYVDDFFATLLSAHFFNKILKSYGITAKHCFRIQFTWEEVKPVLSFSIRTGLPGYFNAALSYIAFLITINYIPQYTTIMFLSVIGGTIPTALNYFGSASSTSLISESYMNGKPILTQYYIGQEIRFNFFTLAFWIPIVMILVDVMPDAWTALGMAQYVIAVEFMFPSLIRFSIERFLGTPGSVMYGSNKPNFGIVTGMINTAAITLLKYIYLVVLALPHKIGFVGTIWLITIGDLPIMITIAAINYTYVHKKIIKIKLPWKQMIIGMAIPTIISTVVMRMIYIFVFNPLNQKYGFFIALIPGLMLILLALLFVYFPCSGFFGGWDTVNLDEFRKAALMSGPSKFLVIPIYKTVEFACRHSPFHNKFALPTNEVVKSAKELLILKRTNREQFKKQNQNEK